MAGEQHWPKETRDAAVRRIHLGEPVLTVSRDINVPLETVRSWHQASLKKDLPPYPGDKAVSEMVELAGKMLWDELQTLDQQRGKQGARKLDVKRVGDILTQLKTLDQLKRANPPQDEKPEAHPLDALTNGNA
jgi:hypothetical protein